jgi:drug/metabolite transporter (DMT)-like permease
MTRTNQPAAHCGPIQESSLSDPIRTAPRPRLVSTSAGSRTDAFGPTEWGLLSAIAAIWGSSFLFMAIGLDALHPAVITWARLGLGTLALSFVPRARRPVERDDLPRVVFLGVVWMAVPLSLFPIAQQWIDSSVAGMLNGAMPLTTAAVSAVLLRRLPRAVQAAGLTLGFLGVVAISWPNVRDADAGALGTSLVLLAIVLYGIAANVAVPLQQRYGSLPVLLRAQAAALVLVTPLGLLGLGDSTWSTPSVLAMIPLGLLGTGLAFALMTVLVGRAGATRGAVAIYFVPVVAIGLGVVVRGEQVQPIALLGTALVLAGAWLTSRREG